MMGATREELVLQIDDAQWDWLRAHLERGGVILVSPELDLAHVGERIAADDTAAISGWIAQGLVGKPTKAQIERWDADRGKRFSMLVVSPYVLAQEIDTLQ